jgi:hypothetical protein
MRILLILAISILVFLVIDAFTFDGRYREAARQ